MCPVCKSKSTAHGVFADGAVHRFPVSFRIHDGHRWLPRNTRKRLYTSNFVWRIFPSRQPWSLRSIPAGAGTVGCAHYCKPPGPVCPMGGFHGDSCHPCGMAYRSCHFMRRNHRRLPSTTRPWRAATSWQAFSISRCSRWQSTGAKFHGGLVLGLGQSDIEFFTQCTACADLDQTVANAQTRDVHWEGCGTRS
jgi:hypothetical protein